MWNETYQELLNALAERDPRPSTSSRRRAHIWRAEGVKRPAANSFHYRDRLASFSCTFHVRQSFPFRIGSREEKSIDLSRQRTPFISIDKIHGNVCTSKECKHTKQNVSEKIFRSVGTHARATKIKMRHTWNRGWCSVIYFGFGRSILFVLEVTRVSVRVRHTCSRFRDTLDAQFKTATARFKIPM